MLFRRGVLIDSDAGDREMFVGAISDRGRSPASPELPRRKAFTKARHHGQAHKPGPHAGAGLSASLISAQYLFQICQPPINLTGHAAHTRRSCALRCDSLERE